MQKTEKFYIMSHIDMPTIRQTEQQLIEAKKAKVDQRLWYIKDYVGLLSSSPISINMLTTTKNTAD